MHMSPIRHKTLKKVTENLTQYIEAAINEEQVIGITTDEGNAILLSEDTYNEMLSALEAVSNNNYAKVILKAKYADESLLA